MSDATRRDAMGGPEAGQKGHVHMHTFPVRYMKVEAVRHIRPIWQRLDLPFTIANLRKEVVKVWTWGLRVTTTKICHQGAFITIFTIITIFTLPVGANQILGSHSLASLTLRSSGIGLGYPNTHSSGPIDPLPACLPACLPA